MMMTLDPGRVRRHAHFALALLFGVNFLNYIDRYVIAAVAVLIQRDFGLKDTEMGLVGSMFMVAYIVASPVTGVLGDRVSRFWLVGGGVLVWSVATVLSGFANSYPHLLLARSFIGLGEAGFGVVAASLISDLFAREKRGRMLSYFYVAIPVGSAIGFLLGGYVGSRYGWRPAFLVAGAPGLVLGLVAFLFKDPPRGAGDGVSAAHERTFDWRSARELPRNRSFLYTTLGMAAMTFALGGMAYWMPTFLTRERQVPLDEANALFGGMTVVSGLLGTFLGGWLGDRLQKRTDRAYLLVSGWGMMAAVPLLALGLLATDRRLYLPAIFLAEVCVFLNTGPANAVLVNVVVPEIRVTAIALSIFAFHLVGDVPSPILIGKVSDATGDLGGALLLASVAMAVSGVFYLWGARFVGEDTRRVLATVAGRERDAQGTAGGH